jgi:hypothetical protein
MASLKILKVALAEVSVTCTFKLTALPEPLLICICFTITVASLGAENTFIVPVEFKFIP